MPKPPQGKALANGIKHGYRSGLEEQTAEHLRKLSIPFEYEPKGKRVPYLIPASKHTYTPDFVFPNGLIVETKGRFTTADRKKHQLIKQQHPELDIRFVFQNANAKLYKGSPTTYAMWCKKNGFLYAHKTIPEAWLKSCQKKD